MNFANVKGITIPQGSVKKLSIGGVDVWKKSELPSDYQELSYIESTGTQYIQIPNIITTSVNAIAKYQILNADSSIEGGIFGTQLTDYQNYFWYKYSSKWYYAKVGNKSEGNYGTADTNIHTVSYNKANGEIKLDNVVIGNTNIVTQPRVSNLTVFCRLGYDSQLQACPMRLFGLTLINNSTNLKIGNFIPCYRKSDGEVGLWDTVSETFFTNAGTGSFRMGAIVDYDFTATYQQVEYIQSTGTQYLNTGVNPTQNYKFKFQAYPTEYHNYGYLYGTHPSRAGCCMNYGSDYAFACMYNRTWFSGQSDLSNIKETDFYFVDSNIMYKNGTSVGSTSASTFTASYNLFLFAMNPGYAGHHGYYKVWMFNIYNGSTMLRQYVPCYRKSDSVAGMYDMVNKVFYQNSGTGAFTVGADINIA